MPKGAPLRFPLPVGERMAAEGSPSPRMFLKNLRQRIRPAPRDPPPFRFLLRPPHDGSMSCPVLPLPRSSAMPPTALAVLLAGRAARTAAFLGMTGLAS